MRIVRKCLECDWIHIVSIVVLHEVELDQLGGLEGLSIDRICSMLLYPRQDICEVEDDGV